MNFCTFRFTLLYISFRRLYNDKFFALSSEVEDELPQEIADAPTTRKASVDAKVCFRFIMK